jgi:Histidine kinase
MTDAVVQPTTPEAATARLTELSNTDWAAKVAGNDPTAFSEFQALTKTAAGGIAEVASATAAANDAKLVSDFLAAPPAGWPDAETPAGKDLAEILQGKPISQELHDAVTKKLSSLLRDQEWAKRLEARDEAAVKTFYLATTLASAAVSEKAK